MFNLVVEWLDPNKTRARFSLPSRTEWRAEHLEALIDLLAQIRQDMSSPAGGEPPAERIRIKPSLSEQEEMWQRAKKPGRH